MTALIASVLLAGISSFAIAVPQIVGTPQTPANDAQVQCTAEPRAIEEIVALEEQIEGTPTDESSAVFIPEVPTGSPADAATVDIVTNVVLELAVCVRLGEPLRTYALYTDAYLTAIAASNGSLIEPPPSTPASDEPVNQDVHLAAIQEVTLLDDGRVSAIVTIEGIEDSHPAPGRTFLMIFAQEDERWLIDGRYEKVWDGDQKTAHIDVADLNTVPSDGAATPQS